MNPSRLIAVLLPALLATACASAPKPASAPPPAPVVVEGSASADAGIPAALPAVPPIDPATVDAAAETAASAATSDDASAEDDFAAIYGSGGYNPVADPTLPAQAQAPVAYDPWEKFNRKVHTFNNAVDRAVARPLARAYAAAVPRPVRLGVGNFFDNLRQPLTMVNQLLQGRPRDASQTFGRFVVNSTLGIGGIFDPASDLKMKRRSEDFGQTLGVWGWRRSRYVELPFFGPRTVRDVLGLAGDIPLSPVRQIEDDKTRIFLQGLYLVDTRAQLLSLDSLRTGAVDDYALVRDAWLQRRNYQIEGSRSQQNDDNLPEYLQDDSDPTVPVDAMPMPEISGGG